MLLSLFIRCILSNPSSDRLPTYLARVPRTLSLEVQASWTWTSIVESLFDFLVFCPVTFDTYELHVQVLSLLLLMAVLDNSGEFRKPVSFICKYANDLEPELRYLHSNPMVTSHPLFHSFMLLGSRDYSRRLIDSSKSRTKQVVTVEAPASSQSPLATVADGLLYVLLRNICIDGSRSDESVAPCGSETSSAAIASTKVHFHYNSALTEYLSDLSKKYKTDEKAGVFDSIANAATSVLTLPYNMLSGIIDTSYQPVARPLAERSACLLLHLVHNMRNEDQPEKLLPNPFRSALIRLSFCPNLALSYSDPMPDYSNLSPQILFPAERVVAALGTMSEMPLGVCLSYTLLQATPLLESIASNHRALVALVLPILKQVYNVPILAADSRYILLITLLILTQDAKFCVTVHRDIVLKPQHTLWYTQSRLGDISLGSLIMLVLFRAINNSCGASSIGTSDTFLHTNCLATIANLSPYAISAHPQTAQKFVGCIRSLYRRHVRMLEKINQSRNTHKSNHDEDVNYLQQLIGNNEQCIRIVLDALLASMNPTNLASNIAILYEVIRERDIFDTLGSDSSIGDGISSPVAPVLRIVNHFTRALNVDHEKDWDGDSGGMSSFDKEVSLWHEEDFSKKLVSTIPSWEGGIESLEKANELRQLKFTYKEDEHPEVFFVPYCSKLTCNYTSDLQWQYDSKVCRIYEAFSS